MEEIALRSAELARVLVGVTKRPERVKLTKEFIKDVLLLNIKGSDFPREIRTEKEESPEQHMIVLGDQCVNVQYIQSALYSFIIIDGLSTKDKTFDENDDSKMLWKAINLN
ncbi:hypothetical protein CAPTEDRAFT_202839 [Capitella teleta]|uniref:Uncharacterized protein n=1 Tax=Capitella teleta TaxID=283909 RepID=R7T4Y0_CAPTE|nr:hypothetical protein CAPTEDRAFT_202839 [Capitella teleta]|eukprot:ELT87986.1 hypothetical protein CAPTEDRAFT_202839 [Capitella teleta]